MAAGAYHPLSQEPAFVMDERIEEALDCSACLLPAVNVEKVSAEVV